MTVPIIVAADELDLAHALELAEQLGERAYAIKIHELYDKHGAEGIRKLRERGAARIWVDHKLHDIPNTVGLRAKVLHEAGADIISVHASGGMEMMQAAVAGARSSEVYAITVLTSLTKEATQEIYNRDVRDEVLTLARLAVAAGVAGIVCSPQEVAMLAQELPGHIKLVTPGVRSTASAVGDQQRVSTPVEAQAAGATYLVIGRQITQSADPLAAFTAIEMELTNKVST